MIQLPVGFDASLLIADFVDVGLFLVGIGGLFAAWNVVKKVLSRV